MKSISIEVKGKTMYWCQTVQFQGSCTLYVSPEKEKTRSYNHLPSYSGEDIIVASKSRGADLQVLRPDLMEHCPFTELHDGFSFTAPDGAKLYDNIHATQL